MTQENERKRKWNLYKDALNWIAPLPSWKEKCRDYSVNDFIEHFHIDVDEANKLINKLITDNKLKKTNKDGLYKAVLICSMCGKEFDDLDIQENNHIVHCFGYGSKYDLNILDIHLCIDCFDKMIDTILPLFTNCPLRELEMYNNSDGSSSIQIVDKHIKDPY